MKKILVYGFILCFPFIAFAQSKETGTEREAILAMVRNSDTLKMPVDKNVEAIKSVLGLYRNALEKNNLNAASGLFSADAIFYESGKTEGDFLNYLNHHSQEFKTTKSNRIDGYSVKVELSGSYAFTVETFGQVTLTSNNIEEKRYVVATSVLKKIKGIWKIKMTHASSAN